MCDYPDPTAPIAGLYPLRRVKTVSICTVIAMLLLAVTVALSLL
jgi:hypothetical protein